MNYDIIIVGGGIAGLTAAAFLTKAGHNTLLCEKESSCGGLVSTFERGGFFFDGGIRAIENTGIVFPMLKQLGLDVEFVKNQVSIGIEDRVIRLESPESIKDYQALLTEFYPENRGRHQRDHRAHSRHHGLSGCPLRDRQPRLSGYEERIVHISSRSSCPGC